MRRVRAQLRRQRGAGDGATPSRTGRRRRRLRDAAVVAAVVAGHAPPAATPRAWEHDPAGAAERFMRRLIGDARWERLPQATREARRAEGPALRRRAGATCSREAPWSPERIARPGAGDARRARPGAPRARDGRRSQDWFDTRRRDDRRRPPLRAQHPPRRGRRGRRRVRGSARSLVRQATEQRQRQRQRRR